MRVLVRGVALMMALVLGQICLAQGADHDQWYVIDLAGGPSGYMRSVQSTAEERITSSSEMFIRVRRADSSVSMKFESEFVETVEGEPVSMKSVNHSGKTPVVQRFTFGKEGIEMESTQGANTTKVQLGAPDGAWLPPAAAGRYVQARMAGDAKKIVVRSMDPLLGPTPVTAETEVVGEEEYQYEGRKIRVFRCRVTQSASPGIVTTTLVDEQGIPVHTSTQMGALAMTIRLATRAEALATLEGAGPELMVSTFVKPARAIKDPRQAREAVFVLKAGSAMPDLPHAGAQSFERIDAASARVKVHPDKPLEASAGDLTNGEFTSPSAMINSDDEAIRSLAKANAKGDTPAQRAQSLRAFVHRHMTQANLGTGFATASEVARTRSGDCSEFGVLLAALLRADNIPSRVASGLVYVEQFGGEKHVFGYHMWAQALVDVDGKKVWMDLDATIPMERFDATHIALAVTALGEGQLFEAMAPLGTLIGDLSIAVEDVKK